MDSLEQLDDVLAEDVELVLLNNVGMPDADRGTALRLPRVRHETRVVRRRDAGHHGGYAGTGIDCLAVGARTHSVRVLDSGLDI